ncbi:MAG: hypothetical protein N3H31_02030 [Candidatus Nezhaarchaeota archaeon]|nr:hypothetical protein [Candidatus Nezhaarchaeota archaeon]
MPYGYGDLAPYTPEEQLCIRHTFYHQAYVNGANAILRGRIVSVKRTWR